jgi:hypothetical protein
MDRPLEMGDVALELLDPRPDGVPVELLGAERQIVERVDHVPDPRGADDQRSDREASGRTALARLERVDQRVEMLDLAVQLLDEDLKPNAID